MNINRFHFVEIVSTLFQIILFVGNFLGFLYLFEGNIAFSIAGSILISILYFFLIQLLVDNKEIMYKNKFLHATSMFWGFYIGLAFFSGYLLTHYINIEFNAKKAIQQSAYEKIDVVSKAIDIYKKRSSSVLVDYEMSFKTNLNNYKFNNDLNSYNILVGPLHNINPISIKNKNFSIDKIVAEQLSPMQFKIETNLHILDSVFKTNNQKYETVFKNWRRLSLMQTYVNLNDYVEKSTNIINEKIKELPLNNNPVKFSFNKNTLALSSPSLMRKQFDGNIILPFILIVIIHFFLILPFVTQKVRIYTKPSSSGRNFKKDVKNKIVQKDLDLEGGIHTDEPIKPHRRNTGGSIEL
jgi:hypothetical protein